MAAITDTAQQVLSLLQKRAPQAEVYAVQEEATKIQFEANKIKSAQVDESQGVAARALVEGRIGFSATSGRIDQDVLVERVLASSRFGEPVALHFPGATKGVDVTTYDAHLTEIPLERFVEIGEEAIARLLESDADAQVNVSIERGVEHMWLYNSAGAEVDQHVSYVSVSVDVERVRGDDVLIAYDGWVDITLTDGYCEMLSRLAQRVALAKRLAMLESGRMPVLFAPSGALVLLLPLVMATNGEAVQRGTSPLANRQGEQVFDPCLTLWDDPTLSGRPYSASHDDEGVPCRRKALIRQGVVETFLYDLKTAALMGTESTGNGARSLFGLPSPSATNLVLEGSDTPLEKMIQGIERGLLVTSVLGLGQGNPISGAFSNPIGVGYAIEKGEIVGRVKNVAIAGNIYDLLKEIGGLSRESEWVHGRYRLPYILLNALNVVQS